MAKQAPRHPATADAALGRAAYEAEAAWLAEIMPGGRSPSWDDLDPEHREVYRRIAGPVAAAERERIRQLALQHGAVWCERQPCTCIRLGSAPTIRSFADLIREPT
jgi:hypothetical protein